MGTNLKAAEITVPGHEGWEAVNKGSALHEALKSSQHWYRCATLLQAELNKREDQADKLKLYSVLVPAIIGFGCLGWFLFFVT